MPLDRERFYKAVHRHQCATPGCPNYFVCHDHDCRTDWTCPTCEDNELAEDITRQEVEKNRNATIATNAHS